MALFSRVTVWVSNQVLTAAALNGEFNNILNNAQIASWVGYSATVSQMQTLWNPQGVGTENQPVSGADEVASLRYMIKFLSGATTQWYDSTGRNLGAGNLAVEAADITAGAVTPAALGSLNFVVSATSGPFTISSGLETFHAVAPPSESPTISIASPCVITIANTNVVNVNDQVVFTTTGALPTGLTAGTHYFVQQINSSTQFQVSLTAGGAAINTSGSQTGTQTITYQGLTTTPLGLTVARPVLIMLQDDASGNVGTFGNYLSSAKAGLYTGITQSGSLAPNNVSFNYQLLRDGAVISAPQLSLYQGNPAQALFGGLTGGTNYYVATTSGGSPTHAMAAPSFTVNPYTSWAPSSVFFIDTGASVGTHTYSLKIQDVSVLGSVGCFFTRLIAIGL